MAGLQSHTPSPVALTVHQQSRVLEIGFDDGRVFRIGHMGDLNEPTVLGALASVEMALKVAKVPHGKGGLDAAMASLAA